jgi:hypothetical protein
MKWFPSSSAHSKDPWSWPSMMENYSIYKIIFLDNKNHLITLLCEKKAINGKKKRKQPIQTALTRT